MCTPNGLGTNITYNNKINKSCALASRLWNSSYDYEDMNKGFHNLGKVTISSQPETDVQRTERRKTR